MFSCLEQTNPIPYPSLTLVLILVQRRNRPSSASKHLQLLPQTIIQPKQCHKSIAYLQCGEVASHCSPEKKKNSKSNEQKILSRSQFLDDIIRGRRTLAYCEKKDATSSIFMQYSKGDAAMVLLCTCSSTLSNLQSFVPLPIICPQKLCHKNHNSEAF